MKPKEKDGAFSFYSEDWLLQKPKDTDKVRAKPKTTVKQVFQKAMAKPKLAPKNPEARFLNQAKWLLAYRNDKKLSQEDMGRELGGFVDQQTARQSISEVERGRRGVALSMIKNIDKSFLKSFIKAYLQDCENELKSKLGDS